MYAAERAKSAPLTLEPPDKNKLSPQASTESHPPLMRSETFELAASLSKSQRALLRQSYEQMKEHTERNGMSVFIRLFQDYPHYKELWPQFRSFNDSALMGAPELRTHANVYMSGLAAIIDQLDDEAGLTATLRRVAAAHQRKGVRKFHIETMLPTVLATLHLCMDALTPQVQEAWTALFDAISAMVEDMKLDALAARA